MGKGSAFTDHQLRSDTPARASQGVLLMSGVQTGGGLLDMDVIWSLGLNPGYACTV